MLDRPTLAARVANGDLFVYNDELQDMLKYDRGEDGAELCRLALQTGQLRVDNIVLQVRSRETGCALHWTEKVPGTVADVVDAICNLEGSSNAGALIRNHDRKQARLCWLLFEIRDLKIVPTQTSQQLLEEA